MDINKVLNLKPNDIEIKKIKDIKEIDYNNIEMYIIDNYKEIFGNNENYYEILKNGNVFRFIFIMYPEKNILYLNNLNLFNILFFWEFFNIYRNEILNKINPN